MHKTTYKMFNGSQQTPKMIAMATSNLLVLCSWSCLACCLLVSFTVVFIVVSRYRNLLLIRAWANDTVIIGNAYWIKILAAE